MPGRWESTILLRVTDVAYVRSVGDGRESQELVECPHCHRHSDWLIAASGRRVEFACRCGHGWLVAEDLARVVAMAEAQPIARQWQSFDDVRHALGFRAGSPLSKRGRLGSKARTPGLDGGAHGRRESRQVPQL